MTGAGPDRGLRDRASRAEEAGRRAEAGPAFTATAAEELCAQLEPARTVPSGAVLVTGDGLDAAPAGRSWRLSGTVPYVSLPAATSELVVVSTSRPLSGRDRGRRVHRVPLHAAGVHAAPLPTLDLVPAVRLELDGVLLGDERMVGPPRDATTVTARSLDRAALVAVAEMLGAATAALDAATSHVRQRHQFGAPLGDRQAVQHRAADMVLWCTLVRALLDDALAAIAAGSDATTEVACAVALATRSLPLVTAGAHQLHGGVGYMADRPLHRWHRRVGALAAQVRAARGPETWLAAELAATGRVLS